MGRQQADRFGILVAQLDPQTLFAFYFTFHGEGQLQRLPTAAWEIEKLEEFVVFAPGVCLALPLDVFARLTPIRDSGEGPSPRGTPKSWRRGGGSPPIEHDRLTGGPVGEAKSRHHRAEIVDSVRGIVRDCVPIGIVRPIAGVFDVVHCETQSAKALEIVKYLPCHACEGHLPYRSEDDQSQPRGGHHLCEARFICGATPAARAASSRARRDRRT